MIKFTDRCGVTIYFNVFNIISVQEQGNFIVVKHKTGATQIKGTLDSVVSTIEKALIKMATGARNV